MKKTNLYNAPTSPDSVTAGLVSTALSTAGLNASNNPRDMLARVDRTVSALHLTPDFSRFPRRDDWAGRNIEKLCEIHKEGTLAPTDLASHPVARMSLWELMEEFIDLVGTATLESGMHTISIARSLTYRTATLAGDKHADRLFPPSLTLSIPIFSELDRKYKWGKDASLEIRTNRINHVWTVLYAAAAAGNHPSTEHAVHLLNTPPVIAAIYAILSVYHGKLYTYDPSCDPWNFVLTDHVATYTALILLHCGVDDTELVLSDAESGMFVKGLSSSRPEIVMEGFVDTVETLLGID